MKIDMQREATAGLTSQAAAEAVENRYDLVLIAARRVRELRRGDAAKVATRHGPTFTALMEIEDGHVGRDYLLRSQYLDQKRGRQHG